MDDNETNDGDDVEDFAARARDRVSAVMEKMKRIRAFGPPTDPIALASLHAEFAAEITDIACDVGKFCNEHDGTIESIRSLEGTIASARQVLGLDESAND